MKYAFVLALAMCSTQALAGQRGTERCEAAARRFATAISLVRPVDRSGSVDPITHTMKLTLTSTIDHSDESEDPSREYVYRVDFYEGKDKTLEHMQIRVSRPLDSKACDMAEYVVRSEAG